MVLIKYRLPKDLPAIQAAFRVNRVLLGDQFDPHRTAAAAWAAHISYAIPVFM